MSINYKIGYIDEDINQFNKYKRNLRDLGFDIIGYEYSKGMSLDELMQQVYKTDIDLLLIDYRLNESNILSFNGEEIERHIYENKPLFPHIIFTNKIDQAEPIVDDIKIIIDKEDVDLKTQVFVDTLNRKIIQYQKFVTKKKEIISQLLEKEKEIELNEIEKDLLLNTQRELKNLDKSIKNEIPEQLATNENLESISKIRKEAEVFLKSLIDKKSKK